MTPDELEALAVNSRGDPNQKERFAAGLLPEDEVLTLVRRELFRAFEVLPLKRWHLSKNRSEMLLHFKHDRSCMQARSGRSFTYETTELGEATAEQWDVLQQVRRAATKTTEHPWLTKQQLPPSPVRTWPTLHLEQLAHWVTCQQCDAEESRAFVKITIYWAGRELVREYAL